MDAACPASCWTAALTFAHEIARINHPAASAGEQFWQKARENKLQLINVRALTKHTRAGAGQRRQHPLIDSIGMKNSIRLSMRHASPQTDMDHKASQDTTYPHTSHAKPRVLWIAGVTCAPKINIRELNRKVRTQEIDCADLASNWPC